MFWLERYVLGSYQPFVAETDREAILNSVKKAGRCVTIEQGCPQCGIDAEIAAMIMETDAFKYLDAPMERVIGADAIVVA
jgi:pyruvate/2-oxoglutarate/acetoin dehydrogenase E1 component